MELEINGRRAEIENSIIAITRKVLDINNPGVRNIDITNRFNISRNSQINNEIFNSAYFIQSNNFALDRIYRAKIIDQFFLFNGTGYLKGYDNNNYQLQIQESSKDVLDDLQSDLNKLDVDQFDFTFTNANYSTLSVLAVDDIWIWPVVAMHQQRIIGKTRYTAGDSGLAYSRPMFRWKKLLELMFESKNWTLEYDSDIIDNIAITSNAQNFYVTSYQKTFNQSFVVSTSEQLTGLDTNDFENAVTTTINSIDIGSTTTKFRVRGIIESDVNVILEFNALSTSGDNEIDELFIPSGTNTFDFTTGEFKTSDINNVLTIFLKSTSANVTFTNLLIYTIIEESELGNFSSNNLIDYRVKAYDNLPDIKQIDIFLDTLIITNSIIIPNSLESNINLKSLGNINKYNSLDWSDKFDQDTENVSNNFNGLGKINNLIYSNDLTVANDIGKSTFNTDIDNLPDEIDYIQLQWGASIDSQINSLTTMSIEIYTDTDRVSKLENNKNINDRITYLYESGAPGSFTVGRFLDLEWSNLKENYYKKWFQSLLNPRIISGMANLNKSDVLGFDFMKLVYIEYYKAYFFVLDLNDFRSNFKTNINLFKII